MKRILPALLLCLLLLGCGPAAPSREFRLTPTKETENDNLRCYPLDAADCRFFTYGNDLLVLHPEASSAQLLRCRGKSLAVMARAEVPISSVLLPGKNTVCCYDSLSGRVLLFSPELTETASFPLPDCRGTPLGNADGSRIYYCTDFALMELSTETGIHRTLRQQEGLCLTGLLEQQGLIVCGGLLLNMDDGSLAYTAPTITGLGEWGSRSLVCARCGSWDCLYLGQTMLPLPQGWRFLVFLPERNASLVRRQDGSLAIYDLSTGKVLAELEFGPEKEIGDAWATEDGRVFFTSADCLWQWEPTWKAAADSRITITALYTREQPDEKGLAQCRRRGAYLENQYGLELLLNEAVLPAIPAGVQVEPEYVSVPILDTLSGIEAALGKFPKEMMKAAFSGCGRVYLCPVRRIEAEGKEQLGLQFWSGRDCYLLIAASADLQRGVLQALMPLFERQLLMRSDALDRWDSLNPPGFAYGGTDWDETAFADDRCLESPSADRVGLLCAAMEPGNRELFLSVRLQNKLRALCQGFRQVFNLDANSKKPWEQYLWHQ